MTQRKILVICWGAAVIGTMRGETLNGASNLAPWFVQNLICGQNTNK
jgi:hypothetical protein